MMENAGKINEEYFKQVILPNSGFRRKEVLVGPNFGVDVALIDLLDERAMALTSDPLSLIPTLGLQESAWLSVHLMANDIATTSFSPQYLQTVLNLPTSISDAQFREYWQHIDHFCQQIDLAITGGHTGSIEGQNSTIAGGGTMITIAPKDKILISNNAQIDDLIVMTKQCAMSSVAILALSFPKTVKQQLGTEIAQKASDLFYQTSVLKEAEVVRKLNDKQRVVNAMHDVTEGGVLGAVLEMSVASGLGVEVNDEKIPRTDVETAVCKMFGLDSRYCIGAGSMILSVNPAHATAVVSVLVEHGLPATVIGKFVTPSEGRTIIEDGQRKPLPYFETDPYWAAFFEAYNKGWK